jgi:hypothetical protein
MLNTVKGGRALFWSLTPPGYLAMLERRAVRNDA